MGGPAELEIAQGLLLRARQRAGQGQLDAGVRLAERARDLFMAADALSSACEAARVAAELRARRGDLGGARELHEWIVDEAGAAGHHAEVAQSRTDLGNIAEATGDLDAAFREHSEALESATRSERPDLVAMGRGNLGRLHQRRGDLDAARAELIASRDGFRTAGVASGAVNATICLGDLERQRGQLKAARATFEDAATAARQIGHARLEALAALNLGHAARDLGERERAIAAFERAGVLAEPIAEPLVLGGARLGLGLLLADSGPADIALGHFEAAEAIFLAHGNQQTAVAANVNAAAIACRLGNLRDGHARMRRALELLRDIGDARGVHEITLALAEVALAMGRPGETEALLAEYDDPAPFGPRMVRRRQLLEARLATRALQVDLAASLLDAHDGEGELTHGEAFAVGLMGVEIGLLVGRNGVLDDVYALAAGVDAAASPREAAAAANVVGLVLLWLGDLDGAEASFAGAVASWRRIGERVGEATAMDGLVRARLLNGATVDDETVAALRGLRDELQQGGALDAADGLALLIALVDYVAAAARDELPEDVAAAAATLAQRARRGNRLAVWIDLHLLARVLDDEDAAQEAAELARQTAPAAPTWARLPDDTLL